MKRIALSAAVGLLCATAILSAGKAVSRSDARALKNYDKHHVEMLARNCGASGRLMQDPLSGEYFCQWTNPDGEMVAVATPSFPYLNQVARK